MVIEAEEGTEVVALHRHAEIEAQAVEPDRNHNCKVKRGTEMFKLFNLFFSNHRRRSATEETLDIADEYATTQVEQRRPRSRSQERDSDMGRERERSSRPRDTPYQTATRSRPQL